MNSKFNKLEAKHLQIKNSEIVQIVQSLLQQQNFKE